MRAHNQASSTTPLPAIAPFLPVVVWSSGGLALTVVIIGGASQKEGLPRLRLLPELGPTTTSES
jgi:hypothetical protein